MNFVLQKIRKYPDDNNEQLWEVFHVTFEWIVKKMSTFLIINLRKISVSVPVNFNEWKMINWYAMRISWIITFSSNSIAPLTQELFLCIFIKHRLNVLHKYLGSNYYILDWTKDKIWPFALNHLSLEILDMSLRINKKYSHNSNPQKGIRRHLVVIFINRLK